MKFLPVAFLFLAAIAQAVQPAGKPGSLSGTLSKYGGGEPIRNADISVSKADGTARVTIGEDTTADQAITVVTDHAGRFRFPSLFPGEYTLSVRKNGFHGFRGPNSRTWQDFLSVTIPPGQAVNDLALTMQPGSVISGHITDEEGEPMAYVQVSALKWVYANHRRQLRPIGTAATDDQGSYRIFSLEPGHYVVRANVAGEGGQMKMHYAPAYFPDSASPLEASPVALRAGDQAVADFRMQRVQAIKVSGRVTGASGTSQVQIYLRNTQDEGAGMARAGGATADASGHFTLDNVLPGDYVLGALEFRADGGDTPQHAEIPIRVENGSGDLANVALSLEDTGKAVLLGSLRLDGDNLQHPRLDSLRVGLLPADDSTANGEFIGTGGYAAVGPNGVIRLDKISPGKYVVSITADGNGWEDFYTKSVEIGNQNVTDSVVNFTAARGTVPINIVVGIDGATVDGTVTDENGKPVANASVIGVPELKLRSQFDLYQRGETDRNGHFQLRGIKPGSYSFYAWNAMEDESYMDPEFLRRYENARVDLQLPAKSRQTIQLKLLTTDEE